MKYEPVSQRFPKDSLIGNIESSYAGEHMLCKILTVHYTNKKNLNKSVMVEQFTPVCMTAHCVNDSKAQKVILQLALLHLLCKDFTFYQSRPVATVLRKRRHTA
jgi:hypothetical protein